jgi:aconitate hydratase
MSDSFKTHDTLEISGQRYEFFRFGALSPRFDTARLPYCLKVLLENLLRHENGVDVTAVDIEALAGWDPSAEPDVEIAFTPARVLLQDFTGVPAVVDLAAMRDAVSALGGDPKRVNPLSPVELVIDHSVQVDVNAQADAQDLNVQLEYQRNKERYAFLRWGQTAFDNFKVVPPGAGIVHQVNLEYLARVVFDDRNSGTRRAFPDTVVGTDSHTTMVNGLGVLGWGVGGIEAEAAMLGQPVSMLIPQVVGFRLIGALPEGATATDLVLTVVQALRKHGVVGKFVEFFGDGLANLPLADRATIANMAPEYGATCGIFPIDDETLRYLRLSGRNDEHLALVEAYARAQGMFREDGAPQADYSGILELDMGSVEPSIAGPKRPQDRIALSSARQVIGEHLSRYQEERDTPANEAVARFADEGGAAAGSITTSAAGTALVALDGHEFELFDGAVVIAAITSCTNTSNPAVMLAAGLLARNAIRLGLSVKPWVKTSLAPGSLVVRDYLRKAGLLVDLETLGFHIVGFGCTTCIGNSGPLAGPISQAIQDNDLAACAVLSGNRNFEGRIHAEVKMNFLASPPLVVAYALAGSMQIDLTRDPLGKDRQGNPVFLRDIWPDSREIHDTIASSIDSAMFKRSYANIFEGDDLWKGMAIPQGERYAWGISSTYIQNPPYFDGMSMQPRGIPAIEGARPLVVLGDSITTDHISPAGSIEPGCPAGAYLNERQVRQSAFNSYGSRRGNHEVMMRGTFANVRLRNRLAPGTEGGWTVHQPSGEQMTIYDAAMRYRSDGVPLIIFGGKEYGTGSSRDWAAKGTALLGVAAVVVESFERIHRSNLVGMGVLPLQFEPGDNAERLKLDATHTFTLEDLVLGTKQVTVVGSNNSGKESIRFNARVRIDTPKEWEYYEHGGILQYVVRQLAA